MAQKKKGGGAGAARRKRRKAASLIETRQKKEFQLRGLTLPELQELPFEKQLEYLPSRARRSVRRGMSYEQAQLLERVRSTEPGTPIRTHRREMVILPEFVGHTFDVHSGSQFQTVTIQPEMIGHALGEFALTRKLVKHGGVGVGATRGSKHLPLK
jgi:small subunit ribosomal protein S19